MCDCTAVKEILEYDGTISQIYHWSQELLGYQFTVVHRSYKMMMDVDTLSRRFGTLIVQHCAITYMIHSVDIQNRPDAYDDSNFTVHKQTKVKVKPSSSLSQLPIITQRCIDAYKIVPCTETRIVIADTPPLIISSCPVMVAAVHPPELSHFTHQEQPTRMLDIQDSLSVNCVCIDDICG